MYPKKSNHSKSSTGTTVITILAMLLLPYGCTSQPEGGSTAGTGVLIPSGADNGSLRVLCEESNMQAVRILLDRYLADRTEVTCILTGFPANTPLERLATRTGDLIMLSAGGPETLPDHYWNMRYAREGLLLIMNDNHPLSRNWHDRGVRFEDLGSYLAHKIEGEENTRLMNGNSGLPKFFMQPGPGNQEIILATLFGLKPGTFRIVNLACNENMMDSLLANPLAIGICCHRHAYDLITRQQISGISVVPLIRKSGNICNNRENFHEDLDLMQRAIWLGKYPCHVFMNCYILSEEDPLGRVQVDFISWLLTEGSKDLLCAGFIPLHHRSIDEEFQRIRAL